MRGEATPLNLNTRVWLEQHVDGLSIECSTGSIVVQMASPSATFILESVVHGHHIYKLDIGMFSMAENIDRDSWWSCQRSTMLN